MELLFITPAITPYNPGSPVGDVCAALPKALRSGGHRVTVVSPLPATLDTGAHSLARRLSTIPVEVRGKTHACALFDGRTTGGVDLVFVSGEGLFDELEGAPGARAALAFAQAAVEVARTRDPEVQVAHAHGWFGAPSLALLREAMPKLSRVLSLHDFAAEPPVDAADLAALGLPEGSLLSLGVRAAQRVVADSEQQAASLQERGEPAALAAALDGETDKLVSIPGGLDGAYWNPSTDAHLTTRFDPANPERKARCRDALRVAAGLPVRGSAAVLAAIELSAEGARHLAAIAEPLLGNDVQLVLAGLGRADDDTRAALEALAERYPERLALWPAADEGQRHQALGGADLCLVPDPGSAAGQMHLAGQRYGALPVVRPVGVLADGVVDCDARLESGNGFSAGGDSDDDYLSAVERGVAAFTQGEAFAALRARVMTQDVSWERSARRYEYLYKSLKPA